MRGAVEKNDERQVGQPGARLDGIGGGDQLLHERRRVAHAPPFALRRSRERRARCVSRTCSGPRSSGGVRYPHSSAPSWRQFLPSVTASRAFMSSRPRQNAWVASSTPSCAEISWLSVPLTKNSFLH